MYSTRDKLNNNMFKYAYMSIVDDKQMIIENVKSIIECNETKAVIYSSGLSISVWGSELALSSFDRNTIEISGNITSVELERLSRHKSEADI